MYQAWNYWALVSVAESKTLFEITKEECLKEREMGYLATVPRICWKQFYIFANLQKEIKKEIVICKSVHRDKSWLKKTPIFVLLEVYAV